MMQHIYSKPLNQLTEEEWKKVEEFRSKKKPLIAFSTATLYDCGRSDGLALDFDNVTMLNNQISKKVWVLNNENSVRIVINAILTQVLLNQVNEKLSGYCDVKNDWDGPGFYHIGNADYMFGFSRINSVESMESLFLIIQARTEWPDQAVAKVICEAGCLLRSRQAAGKNTPVFAALTNGNLFRFFAIDTDGIVYASEINYLAVGHDGTYQSSTSLSEILRWFLWIMNCIKSISSSASSNDLTEAEIESSISQIRSCFGPKYPIPNKKIRKK